MSITLSPSKAAYLARVAEGLADLAAEDREEVVQDLEAHLAELGDDEVETILGSPESFVAEFRQSAGLVESKAGARPGLVDRARTRLDHWSARLSELTRWPTIRPVWVWTRGWLLVSAWSVLYDIEGFRRFPIPSIGGSSLTGLILVVSATAFSLWLDAGAEQTARSIGSVVLSVVAGFGLIGTLLNPLPTYDEVHSEPLYLDRLTGADGNTVDNIYAYDLDGNSVEVLLFDEEGRPLQTLPSWVYGDAEYLPADAPYDYGDGAVTFARDQFGRIIPNLYPLQLSRYDEFGSLRPVPPPSLGFPSVGEDETPVDDNPVPTTTAPPFG